MPGHREDLSVTNAEANPDLTPGFTYEEMKRDLWDDIDSCLNLIQDRQPGDIDINQMMEHTHKSSDYARVKMHELEMTGKWMYIDVYDPVIKNRRKVIRKVENTA
jgi:hypothetical protein